jgi:hypothetical protein
MQRRWARDEIALVGDSHAGHWRAPVRILARARRWRGTSLTRPGCPLTAARVLVTRPTLASCRQWYREVIRWFERHPEVHIVFVSGHAHFPVAVAPGRSGFAARVAGYVAAWRALPRTVRHILVIRDVPRRRLRTLDCVERQMAARGRAGVACAAPRSRVLRPDPAAVAVSRLSHSRVHIIDLTRFFCSRRLCFPVVGGALVHKDVGHMTTAFAESLAPYMARRVNTLLPPPPGRRGRPARQLASGIRDPSASR